MKSSKLIVRAVIIVCMAVASFSTQMQAMDPPPPDCNHCWEECETTLCAFDVRCSMTNYTCGQSCPDDQVDVMCALVGH